MNDHRQSVEYTCAAGCCHVKRTPNARYGSPAVLSLDGEVGTVVSWAEKLGRPDHTIRSRIDRQLCLKAEKFIGGRGRNKTAPDECATEAGRTLANTFLRMKRPMFDKGELA